MTTVVMYHYVRPTDVGAPHLYYLHRDNFQRQLDYFEKTQGFVKKQDWDDAIRNTYQPPEGVILTFDDGLIDHFEHVRPILLERGLWGTFYVSSDTLTLDKLLNVHRVHFLLGRYGGKHVLRTLEKLLKTEHIIPSFFENLQDQPYQNQDMPAAAKEVKKIVNYAMRPSAKNAVLAQLFKEVAGSEQDVASQYYLNAQQIAQMDAEGFSFGAHGKSHNLLTKFNGNDLLTEVDESITLLNKHLLQPSDTYCYPYGGPDSWNEHTLQALRKKNILYSYCVDPRPVEQADLAKNPLCLPRYDCNAFPNGQAYIAS